MSQVSMESFEGAVRALLRYLNHQQCEQVISFEMEDKEGYMQLRAHYQNHSGSKKAGVRIQKGDLPLPDDTLVQFK